ncbi:MAG: DUF305 domain-containing protein [Candidatus Pacebacteria bacterium]|nr:DUF305 domain-containing protein [Candidatus Paceibacterota bacterium]MBP9843035.1 DUF305 domain-containing protein [Candidatus Paceibacterota bacterium]
MKKQTVLVTIMVLLVGVIGGYTLSKTGLYGSIVDRYNKDNSHSQPPKETFSSEMHGIHDAEVLSEKKFIEGMIPHHKEAVDTANEVLARGENVEVRKLAEAIVTAQEKEISNMKTWYTDWYGESYIAKSDYVPMMPDLSTLSGKELDRAFLEGMIEHHMGALMMAQQVSRSVEHPEITALIQAIAETQSAEIINMRILLKQV